MLSKAHRFHGLGSLNFAYRQGQAVRGPLLSLKFVRNNRQSTYRVAVVVSRKVHKSAVTRNRIRRRVYEAVALVVNDQAEPYDLLLTAHSDRVAVIPFPELERQVRSLFVKADVATTLKQA